MLECPNTECSSVDKFKCHFTVHIKSFLQQNNSNIVVVPPGCTKIVQPADVALQGPISGILDVAENQETTKASNLQAQ